MKSLIQILSVKSKRSPEFEKLFSVYETKIKNFSDLRLDEIKSFEAEREQKAIKVQKESMALENKIEQGSFVILCDERGKNLSSLELAKLTAEQLEIRKKVTFIIGGAFGVSDELKTKADLNLAISPLVLNHLMAKAVLLEQVYRTFTIIHKIPYHNE